MIHHKVTFYSSNTSYTYKHFRFTSISMDWSSSEMENSIGLSGVYVDSHSSALADTTATAVPMIT